MTGNVYLDGRGHFVPGDFLSKDIMFISQYSLLYIDPAYCVESVGGAGGRGGGTAQPDRKSNTIITKKRGVTIVIQHTEISGVHTIPVNEI